MRAHVLFALLVFGCAVPAAAQGWPGSPAPVLRSAADPGAWRAGRKAARLPRSGVWCAENRARLRYFQSEVRHDGRVSVDEVRIANALRADLAFTCGRRTRWADAPRR